MSSIVLCFEVHQPFRVNHFSVNGCSLTQEKYFEKFFNKNLNKFIFDRASIKCYLPTTDTILELVDSFKKDKKKFKCTFNLSGVWLEQCEKWQPDLLENFKQLADSGMVEFLGSTYFHSLAGLFKNHSEFKEQIKMQTQAMKDYLGYEPTNFVNTEMLYNNLIAKTAEDLNFQSIFTEGTERVLEWRSPNHVYARGPVKENDKPLNKRIKVLTRNYRLSDDVGYRFSSKEWNEWPLTAEKYSVWLSATTSQYINVFIDFSRFTRFEKAYLLAVDIGSRDLFMVKLCLKVPLHQDSCSVCGRTCITLPKTRESVPSPKFLSAKLTNWTLSPREQVTSHESHYPLVIK
jgi:alpha-amylase